MFEVLLRMERTRPSCFLFWSLLEDTAMHSVMSNTSLNSTQTALSSATLATAHMLLQHKLDQYGAMRCINFTRSQTDQGSNALEALKQGPNVFQDDKYLMPAVPDDPLLYHAFSAEDANACAPPRYRRVWGHSLPVRLQLNCSNMFWSTQKASPFRLPQAGVEVCHSRGVTWCTQ